MLYVTMETDSLMRMQSEMR